MGHVKEECSEWFGRELDGRSFCARVPDRGRYPEAGRSKGRRDKMAAEEGQRRNMAVEDEKFADDRFVLVTEAMARQKHRSTR